MQQKLIQPAFIHLRVHSAYSLLEGALKIDTIIDHALKDLEPAIAITDSNNLFGAFEFSQKCFKAGIQPLIGCQLAIHFDNDLSLQQSANKNNATKTAPSFPSLVFLAATNEGYNNLVQLVSRAYTEVPSSPHIQFLPPHIQFSWLETCSKGLIILTGGPQGPVDLLLAAGKKDQAAERLDQLHQLFNDRLYVELQRHAHYDRSLERELIALAYEKNIPLVATNESFFLTIDDYEAHDALLAIAEGSVVSASDRRRVTKDHYLKNQKEMAELFADIPEALHNTVEIAQRCHAYIPQKDPILPNFIGSTLSKEENIHLMEAEQLAIQARSGLSERIATHGLADNHSLEDYQKRLEYEISIIVTMKFSGYFLIVSDFIKQAKKQNIAVGPGRGSGAGSLVAYALMITNIDPLRFSLLFERFLNPERVSMPDFDIDFCQERREEVITYVQNKYGCDQVAQIITFGTLQARAVLRDVGRVLEMPYGQVDRLSKLIPSNPANPVSLANAVADEPKFAEEKEKDPVVTRLLRIAEKLEGLYRHASTHAAGIVIGDRPLSQLVPLYRDSRSNITVTQFSMKYVEQAGLVKFDFLGLKTLTILQKTIEFIHDQENITIDLDSLPLNDVDTYAMLSKGETIGVFQLESAGMRKALLGMKPDRIEDIIALVALYRPGPMENIPTYNMRKHGKETIRSIHPKIDYLIKETQGVIIYQEQVMEIAQILAGYSLGEADLLRRAMGKKIRKEMDEQRTRFVDGALERGVSKAQAHDIFDLLAKFADYGFNKSHAAAYALISYQTAYLKTHYPVAFLAATMTYDMSNLDKLNDFRQEAIRLGIEIIPPSIQTSFRIFKPGNKKIYYSLAALKGVGEAVVDHIVDCRGDKDFLNIEDFCERTDPHILNRRSWESLINAGALDCFAIPREDLINGLDRLIAHSQRLAADQNSGQTDIFAMTGETKHQIHLPKAELWPYNEKLQREFQTIGFYLSAHPLDHYQHLLKKMSLKKWSSFAASVRKGTVTGRLAATVTSKQIRKTRLGHKMAIIQLSDSSGQYEAILFSEQLSQYGDLLEPGRSVCLNVTAENRPEGLSIRIERATLLDDEAKSLHKTIRLYVEPSVALQQIATYLSEKGNDQVHLILKKENSDEIEFFLGKSFEISPQIALNLKALPGVTDVEIL